MVDSINFEKAALPKGIAAFLCLDLKVQTDYNKLIPISSAKSLWRYATFFAVVVTTILLVTGIDGFVAEMQTLTLPEVLGLCYFLFVLPWYLTVMGAVALLFWKREEDWIHVPRSFRLVPLLNLIFLVPGLVAAVLFLFTIMKWAFGPEITWLEWVIIIAFLLIVQGFLSKACWAFVRNTLREVFFGSGHE